MSRLRINYVRFLNWLSALAVAFFGYFIWMHIESGEYSIVIIDAFIIAINCEGYIRGRSLLARLSAENRALE